MALLVADRQGCSQGGLLCARWHVRLPLFCCASSFPLPPPTPLPFAALHLCQRHQRQRQVSGAAGVAGTYLGEWRLHCCCCRSRQRALLASCWWLSASPTHFLTHYTCPCSQCCLGVKASDTGRANTFKKASERLLWVHPGVARACCRAAGDTAWR